MENFKEWDLTCKVKLVSTGHLNAGMLHELIHKALRAEAGDIGYLVGESQMSLDQISGTVD